MNEMQPDLSLVDCFAILRKQWRLLLGVPAAVGVVCGLVTLTGLPRKYEAKTTLLIPLGSRNTSSVSALAGKLPFLGGGLLPRSGPLPTFQTIIRSRRLRKEVASELHLVKRFHTASEGELLEALARATTVSIDTKANALSVRVTVGGTPRWCRSRPWGSNDINARKLAADIANSYVVHLKKYLQVNELFQAQHNRAFLKKQKAEAQKRLTAAEVRLLAYQERQKVVLPSAEVKALVENHAELNTKRVTAQVEAQEATDQLGELRQRLMAQAKAGITEALPDSTAVVEEARKQLAQLEVELAVKTERLAPSHPEIRALTKEIDQTKSQLRRELERTYKSVEAGLVQQLIQFQVEKTAAETKLLGLNRAVADLERRLARYPAEMISYTRLQREVQMLQDTYKLLSAEYERAKVEEAREVPQFQVLDSAVPPDHKYAPSTIRNTLLGALLTLLLCIPLAWARETARGIASPAAEATATLSP